MNELGAGVVDLARLFCERGIAAESAKPTANSMDIDDVRDMVRELLTPTTQCALAKKLGLSAQYLSDVMLGRREPGPKLLSALGLSKEVRYVRRIG